MVLSVHEGDANYGQPKVRSRSQIPTAAPENVHGGSDQPAGIEFVIAPSHAGA